jgi:hypothetical protein
MNSKAKLSAIIMAFLISVGVLIIGVWSASQATVGIGGTVSFVANDVYAKVTGEITGSGEEDYSLDELIYSADSEPEGDVWEAQSLSFRNKSTDIKITITIENLSDERLLYVTLNGSTATENNLTKTIKLFDFFTYIPGNVEILEYNGDAKVVTFVITLSIEDKNHSINNAGFDFTIELNNDNPNTAIKLDTRNRGNGVSYALDEESKEASVIGTTPMGWYDDNVRIPSQVEKDGIIYTVTSIEEQAFLFNNGILSIVIPDTVKSIGEEAFMECNYLTTVIIGDGVESIGNSAFINCINLTSLTLGKNVKYIGDRAFYENKLESITIPENVESIDTYAFFQQSNRGTLKSVVFKNTEGWYTTTEKNAESGESIDVTDPIKNAENFTNYMDYYWYHK